MTDRSYHQMRVAEFRSREGLIWQLAIVEIRGARMSRRLRDEQGAQRHIGAALAFRRHALTLRDCWRSIEGEWL